MSDLENNYYVYVYIDPRNFEEFYYGKGKGNRKDAHLKDGSDSDKATKIREIKKAGLQPTIRVIAKWEKGKGLLTTQQIIAPLRNQTKTIKH